MKFVSAFLVVVATPLTLLAAAAIVPIAWLVVTGVLFVAAGTLAIVADRRHSTVE